MDGVVLLHGIARGSGSLSKMERALRSDGYLTLNLDYPSRRLRIQDIADWLHEPVTHFLAGIDGQLHFVTHSMGGLVARAYITHHRPQRIGRVVMLAPPNKGSEVADLIRSNLFYRRFFGPAGAELTTAQDAEFRAMLGEVDYPLGVIAGDRTIYLIASTLVVPRPNDGRVSVAGTFVDGMADHITVHTAHPLIRLNATAIRQTLHFLRQGRFERPDSVRSSNAADTAAG